MKKRTHLGAETTEVFTIFLPEVVPPSNNQ